MFKIRINNVIFQDECSSHLVLRFFEWDSCIAEYLSCLLENRKNFVAFYQKKKTFWMPFFRTFMFSSSIVSAERHMLFIFVVAFSKSAKDFFNTWLCRAQYIPFKSLSSLPPLLKKIDLTINLLNAWRY